MEIIGTLSGKLELFLAARESCKNFDRAVSIVEQPPPGKNYLKNEEVVIVQGNEASVRGAIAAGCWFLDT